MPAGYAVARARPLLPRAGAPRELPPRQGTQPSARRRRRRRAHVPESNSGALGGSFRPAPDGHGAKTAESRGSLRARSTGRRERSSQSAISAPHPLEDQPGPSRPILPEVLGGAAVRPTGRPLPGSVQTPIVAGSEFLFHDSPGTPPPAGPSAGGDRRAHGAVRSVGRPRLRRDHPRPGPLRAGEHYRRCAGHCGSGRAQRRSSGRRPSSPDRVPRRIRLDRCRRRGCGRSNPPRARPRRARPGLLADRRRGRGRVRSDDCPRVRLSRR